MKTIQRYITRLAAAIALISTITPAHAQLSGSGLSYMCGYDVDTDKYRWSLSESEYTHRDYMDDNQMIWFVNNDESGANQTRAGRGGLLPWEDGGSSLHPSKQLSKEIALGFRLKAKRQYYMNFYFVQHMNDASTPVEGGKVRIIKSDSYNQSATYESYQEATIGTATMVGDKPKSEGMYFTYTTGNSDEIFWLSGVDSYFENKNVDFIGYQVKYVDVTAPNLTNITTDTYWLYEDGNGLGSANDDWYSNSDKVYRYNATAANESYKIAATSTPIYYNYAVLGDGTNHSYAFTATDALGFKLDNYRAYRIRVFSDKTDVLYKGLDLSKATAVTGGTSTTVMTDSGSGYSDSGTRIMTYDIPTGNGGTYWVRCPEGMNLGAIEILPIWATDETLAGRSSFSTSGGSWKTTDQQTSNNNTLNGSTNGPKTVTSGNNGSYVYVYGPSMTLTEFKNGDVNSVMLNSGNRIGFKVPAGSKVKFNYVADPNVGVTVTHNGTTETYTNANAGEHSVEYPAGTDTYTSGEETIWISGESASYVYFSGFEVETQGATPAQPVTTLAIPSDYVWTSDKESGVIAANSTFGADYLGNSGSAMGLIDGASVKANGTFQNLYDNTDSNGYISFNVESGKAGEVRVIYDEPSLANYDYPIADMTVEWDGANILSKSGNVITIDNQTENAEWPHIGFNLNSTGEYNKVAIKMSNITSSNNEAPAWAIKLVYSDEQVENYTTSDGNTYCEFDIDPDRMLQTVMFLSACSAGVTQTFTIDYIRLTRTTGANGDKAAATLHPTSLTADATGRLYHLEGGKVISHYFTSSDPHTFYVKGGGIAGIEVLVTDNAENNNPGSALVALTNTQISGNGYTWNVEDALGSALVSGNNTVLNGNRSYDNGNIYVFGSNNNPSTGEFARVNYAGTDLVINSTKVNGKSSVMIDAYHAIGVKLPAGGKYTLTAYYDNCDNTGSVRFQVRDAYARWPEILNPQPRVEIFGSTKPAKFNIETTEETVVWLSGWGDDPAYLSGIKVEETKGYEVVFDVDGCTGIFTGKYLGPGDTEEHLLVYCTDNGTYENFRVPKAYFIDGSQPNKKTDITPRIYTTTNFVQVSPEDFKVEGATDNDDPYIAADPDMEGQYRIFGFEDTDNDIVYRVNYSFTDGGGHQASNYYYVWFANYLKIGWWTNREAKLIVGSDNSAKDPEHLMCGDFYISSGETADLLYDVINPGKDKDNNVVSGYESSQFTIAEWSFTGDRATEVKSDYQEYDSEERFGKSDNDNATIKEEFSYTKMNDHKNMPSKAIRMAFPKNYNAANWPADANIGRAEGEVYKTAVLTVHRENWPDWTVKVGFHFIPAPTGSVEENGDNTNTVTMTARSTTVAGNVYDSQIYYTTDGTVPSFNTSGTPINATYTYTTPVTNKYTTLYYAAQKVTTKENFYIINPYTTYIEDSDMLTLMNPDASTNHNISKIFIAMSDEITSTTIDPIVEYCNSDRNIVKKKADGTTVNTTQYDAWGNQLSSGQSFSVLGRGGFLYKYPFSGSYREVMVEFGNNTKKSYRESVFKDVGVYWGIDKNNDFKEHFDYVNYQYKTMGYNLEKKYDSTYTGSTQNGNPHTECNGGIGGADTEEGGKWLQPITGDFLRFEPEYDGIITVWMRTNGAGQGDEYKGNITRRPVYVVDENGKVMKRSTIKPSAEHYFGIDGLYAEICENRSEVRHDCRVDWVNGLTNWRDGYDASGGLPWRNMATFRLYNYWYGFPLYQNKNVDQHGGNDWQKYRYSMDVADSWISRTANVRSVVCKFNPIVYHSEQLHKNVEQNNSIVFTHSSGTTGNIYSGDKFALYGWELPAFNVVRYRIPVKAGKSYYIGGRGTKNGYMAMKFDPMPANYDHADYIVDDNRQLYEMTAKGSTQSAFVAEPISSIPTGNANNYKNYDNTGSKNTYNSITTYHLYEDGTASGGENNALLNAAIIDRGNSMLGTTCNVVLHRTFTPGYWHPIVLPFSVSETRLKEMFGQGVRVLYLDPYDNTMTNKNGGVGKGGKWASAVYPAVTTGKLRFTYHHYQMLYANTPAFICPEEVNYNYKVDGSEKNNAMCFYRVTLDKTNLSTSNYSSGIGYKIGEVGQYSFWVEGSYNAMSTGVDTYYLSNETSGGETVAEIWHAASGKYMKGTRCWITARSNSYTPTKPPLLTQVGFGGFDGEEYEGNDPSGIQDIVNDEMNIEMYGDGIYDLLGRKLSDGNDTNGLPQGVYIVNGQKKYVR